jgi:hypothetical protein
VKKWRLSLVPVLLFAGFLPLLQWVCGMPVTSLWLRTILVFAVATAVVRLPPWGSIVFRVRPSSPLHLVSLFALFVRHFAWILAAEGRRAFIARALAVPKPYGPGSFRSLAFAVSSFFSRALTRAERFHAAQLLRGIGE